jgi:hypothetical protein
MKLQNLRGEIDVNSARLTGQLFCFDSWRRSLLS